MDQSSCPQYGGGENLQSMSQETLIKLESEGDEQGVGKGHILYSQKNKKKLKERLRLKKFNPIARKHTWYKETK